MTLKISVVVSNSGRFILPMTRTSISQCSHLPLTQTRVASTLADWIPEIVKDAVKTSVLQEAARTDSKLWNSNQSHNEQVVPPMLHTNATATATATYQPQIQSIQQNFSFPSSSSHHPLNHPITMTRSHMLQDPLDEWYLEKLEPCSILSSSSSSSSSSYSTNSNTNTSFYTSIRLPVGVQPKSNQTDPFLLSKADMDTLSHTIRSDLISIDHPVLNQVAAYFFGGATSNNNINNSNGGKKIRPMMILLLSKAMEIHSTNIPTTTTSSTIQQQKRSDLHPATRRLAEISELIHTASLFHDDVIDGADTRRGTPTVHTVFGNKMAILAGDYLLARASIFLARLRDVEVVESMSTIIEHLVRGEVMQLNKVTTTTLTNTTASSSSLSKDSFTNHHYLLEQRMVYYLRKNFYKTASLMANSCKSAAILGGYEDSIIQSAYSFGKHLGIAFQLVDDVLDYEGNVGVMGKPPFGDLNAGLATAPVLLASQVLPDLIPMIDRKFRFDGDVDNAVQMVRRTNAIQRTMELAVIHAELAMNSIMALTPSPYRDSLIHLAHSVVNRSR